MIQICYWCSEHDDHYQPTNKITAVVIFKGMNKIFSFIHKKNKMQWPILLTSKSIGDVKWKISSF